MSHQPRAGNSTRRIGVAPVGRSPAEVGGREHGELACSSSRSAAKVPLSVAGCRRSGCDEGRCGWRVTTLEQTDPSECHGRREVRLWRSSSRCGGALQAPVNPPWHATSHSSLWENARRPDLPGRVACLLAALVSPHNRNPALHSMARGHRHPGGIEINLTASGGNVTKHRIIEPPIASRALMTSWRA